MSNKKLKELDNMLDSLPTILDIPWGEYATTPLSYHVRRVKEELPIERLPKEYPY
jgi:hypothetical protein